MLFPLLLFVFIFPAFAEDIPVNLKADKLKYNEATDLIEASGSVEVEFEKVKIKADRLVMDPHTNIATAEGHVKITAADYSALADALTFDATSEIVNFTNYQAKVRPQKVKSDLFIGAKKCIDLKNKMLAQQGSVTSCNKDHPHYYAIADRVEYYPNESVIAHNAVVYTGEIPTLWLPYLYYDLHEKRKRSWDFGHNEVEGDYIKTAWNYNWGTLLLDFMSKKGFGQGIDADYALLGLGAGSLYLYHVDEADTKRTDWISLIHHTKKLNDWTTLKFNQRLAANYLIPSGRNDQTVLNLNLDYNKQAKWNVNIDSLDDRMSAYKKYALQFRQSYQNISTNYDFNYEHTTVAPEWLRTSQRFYFQSPLWSDKINFKTHANYYYYAASNTAVGDQRLEPDFEISGVEPSFSWVMKGNWYIDPDKDTYTADNGYQYLERSPEITISPKPINLKYFDLTSALGAGHYHEVRYVSQLGRNRDYSTERYSATLGAGKSFPIGLGTTLSINLGIDQFFYAPGDQLYAYRESGSLNTALFGFFRNSLSFTKAETEGNTPFLFDQLGTRYHNCSETMTFTGANYNWNTTGGYNWQAHRWSDVLTNLSYRPASFMTLSLRTGWDMENTRYKDLVNGIHLVPLDFLTVDLNTTSDMNNGQLKYGNVLYDLFILKGEPNQWHVKFSQVFETASQQFKVRDIMIVKDLHCWELKYTYSDWLKQFSLTFTLKAVPDQPIGYAAGRGLYFDGFERELKKMLNEIKPEGAVTRY
ncbi:MAG: LptA/OstA family protein [Candidatus Margulisbacteria bacterium]|nr:LptA/OstA family protein [Candidatus Margulisiibacteriota bacterium]